MSSPHNGHPCPSCRDEWEASWFGDNNLPPSCTFPFHIPVDGSRDENRPECNEPVPRYSNLSVFQRLFFVWKHLSDGYSRYARLTSQRAWSQVKRFPPIEKVSHHKELLVKALIVGQNSSPFSSRNRFDRMETQNGHIRKPSIPHPDPLAPP